MMPLLCVTMSTCWREDEAELTVGGHHSSHSEDTEDGWEEDTAMIQTKVNYEAKHLHLIYMIFFLNRIIAGKWQLCRNNLLLVLISIWEGFIYYHKFQIVTL